MFEIIFLFDTMKKQTSSVIVILKSNCFTLNLYQILRSVILYTKYIHYDKKYLTISDNR